ncbi:MAG: M48 family metallopeptidase [Ignavibacteriales bacterium]|nr:M48 family metallopeptidase [Ignavibacteriales bacterium]
MMWELIEANKRKSIFIFIGMGLLLILIGFTFGSFYSPDNGGFIGIFFAIMLWGILSMVSYFAGSKILLAVSGAKEVTQDVHPQLYNVVEEMRIAANLPHQPKIYIIADAAPNAFATGIKPENSAIAVTAGLLGTLNRDELQGVVAHEMSHIVNRDVLVMTFAGMMLGAITLMAEVFTRSLWFGGGSRYKSKSSDKGGQAQIIILVLAIALAILGPIMAQLLYFAISRKREYLADASAVRLTRYPDGLASALEKISGTNLDLKTANKVTAPMYIINPLKEKGMQISNLSKYTSTDN